MSKVFSVEKFVDDCKRNPFVDDDFLNRALETWAADCEGMTQLEMLSKNCFTSDDWMEEVEDNA